MHSFDIFDTLIKRKSGEPNSIFKLMQDYLIKSQKIDDLNFCNTFFEKRTDAEKIARVLYCKGSTEEITFEQIYLTMIQLGWIKREQMDLLMTIEKRIEIENTLPIETNVNILHKLIDRGEKVIAISDMYLSSSFIGELLQKCGIPIIKIYVSSETKVCKWTGSMYRYVQTREKERYEDWVHIGDNEYSDVEIPRHFGITPKLYENKDNSLPLDIRGKVVIYGAGKLGTHVKSRLDNNPDCEVVAWVDKWYEECRVRGFDVDSPEEISQYKCDYVLVCVVDVQKNREIRDYLSQKGIDDEKVIDINCFDAV